MRIAFFVWEYPPKLVGGLGTYAENITRKFVELGHDVSVFTLNTGSLPTREIMKGVEVHRPMVADASNVFSALMVKNLMKWGAAIKLFSDIFVYNILSSAKFVNELVRKEKYEYDVVSVHDWLSCISGLMIKNDLNMPLVFHVHSTEWGRIGDGGSEMISHLEGTTALVADRIITVSNAMKDDIVRHGWPGGKTEVVWNGVDPSRYDPGKCKSEDIQKIRDSYGIKEDEKMILFVGRLTWVKGIMNLMQAMPLVLHEFPKTKLVILGQGEQERDITDMAGRLGVKSNITCRFEFVRETDRINHYAASDLCVFPSTYEPFGIVSLEAMSMKKPVVVGAKGVVGFREQVIAGGAEQTGVHVNGGDPADIAWGIKMVLKDPDRARQWGENGRQRVLQYFTWEKTAKQTIEIYEQTLSNRAKKGA